MPVEPSAVPALELWAGVECTVNRVGDQYFDQLEQNGHAARADDLELFARLGVRALRYPVLWERTAPDGLKRAHWDWADERLARLNELGVRAIVGLVHHGSGPRSTSLVDPFFPEKLAAYARAVAERYPWVDAYTPVNEPLTTARFSGLYGHWYPHGRDDLTFARALLTQCRAVVLSMRAIRESNPAARLIQTEDLGKTFSTRALAYQAAFENERRWLSYDLLLGRVKRGHPMWRYLRRIGVLQSELDWFVDNTCPPDVIGINHYLTSERFLDERLGRYPACSHGGNGRDAYADVEAVRVRAEGTAGPRALIEEAWERYGLAVAVTEAHLGCTREEQLRWLKEVWEAAHDARRNGVDVRAVTAWSLLGAYDWDSLVTRAAGHYEPGVFDLRASSPRPTALAHMLRDLGHGREHKHAVLDAPGWWRRLDRLHYPPVGGPPPRAARTTQPTIKAGTREIKRGRGATRPLLIAGATGTLGRAFARICEGRGLSYRLLTRREMDIADPEAVRQALAEYEPWAIVNAAGYVRVDDAEREPALCYRENRDGPATLADQCASRATALLSFSSDLVFDGEKRNPYVETDATAPLNVYGRSKAEGEALLIAAHPSALVIRTSAFFGPWDEYNFVTVALRTLAEGRAFVAAEDATISPTYVPDLVNASLDLLIDGERGIWHLANDGAITWAELARMVAGRAGLDASLVDARPTLSLGLKSAPRPLYSVLGSNRGHHLLRPLEDAVGRYLRECETRFDAFRYNTPRKQRAHP
ncbi:MAG TPA: family 1 glycosylhydrolase [Pyrinomonadaceae bacterium]|jgi:dTDP-4-dehydrorhamnose reductase|nr:family 1 glycosylhydrolase [Pyrinomonadaceae bacterium]